MMQPIDVRSNKKTPETCVACLHFPFGYNCLKCGRRAERVTLFNFIHPGVIQANTQVFYDAEEL